MHKCHRVAAYSVQYTIQTGTFLYKQTICVNVCANSIPFRVILNEMDFFSVQQILYRGNNSYFKAMHVKEQLVKWRNIQNIKHDNMIQVRYECE